MFMKNAKQWTYVLKMNDGFVLNLWMYVLAFKYLLLNTQ